MADRMSKMDRSNRIYAAIDLKSFYASVEVVDRKLDPMTTHLVVADRSRTSKTNLPCGIAFLKGVWGFPDARASLRWSRRWKR